MPATKYIIVTGGVLSGLGKGVATASIGAVLNMMNITKFTIKKLDPYLNVDPGTMNPHEHGEVYVTHDGTETDLDIGYYERFTGIRASIHNSTSSGKLYQRLIERERRGDFLGQTVQMIPHFTNEIKNFIRHGEEHYDVILCEIGGSVGDIEAMAFYEALRQLKNEVGQARFALVHLTYLVHYQASNELKTKPAQNAVRELMQTGLPPDILLCRTEQMLDALPSAIIDKLQPYCKRLIWAPNVNNIYQIPLQFVRQALHVHLTNVLQWSCTETQIDTSKWTPYERCSVASKRTITIAIVGKYVQLQDAYCSLLDAIQHASDAKVCFKWFDARAPPDDFDAFFNNADAVLVPGGFGATGLDIIIDCLRYAREHRLPTLGICLGMQLMVIEFLRHQCGHTHAMSTEHEQPTKRTNTSTKDIVIGLLKSWQTTNNTSDNNVQKADPSTKGGTMRLGAFDVQLRVGSTFQQLYNATTVSERHRHRYEVCPHIVPTIEMYGMHVVAHRDGVVEGVEVKHHPFYIGCQYHPEYNSSPFAPHPLFVGFLRAISL